MNRYKQLLEEVMASGVRVVATLPDKQRYALAAEHWRARYDSSDICEPITEMDGLEPLCGLMQDAMETLPLGNQRSAVAFTQMNIDLMAGLMGSLHMGLQADLDRAYDKQPIRTAEGIIQWS